MILTWSFQVECSSKRLEDQVSGRVPEAQEMLESQSGWFPEPLGDLRGQSGVLPEPLEMWRGQPEEVVVHRPGFLVGLERQNHPHSSVRVEYWGSDSNPGAWLLQRTNFEWVWAVLVSSKADRIHTRWSVLNPHPWTLPDMFWPGRLIPLMKPCIVRDVDPLKGLWSRRSTLWLPYLFLIIPEGVGGRWLNLVGLECRWLPEVGVRPGVWNQVAPQVW